MAKVLIVDDMQSELDLICQYVSAAGYTVVTASNGKEALQKIINSKPDAIVTDWMMPVMGGMDLCRKLKRNPATANIPIIACTAKDRDVDRNWANRQGVSAYITKPYTQADILSALRASME